MTLEYTKESAKEFKKLDKTVAVRIKKYMDEVAALKDPRSRGKGLVGNLSGYWRYRVGDYRILCRIQDDKLVIIVVEIGHRRNVYE
ncbi:MAG: type II toxin-antitoxin system RelE/ParE family toxin [Treponema sp.]|nr:type II toxin-antitoxin system RelE/ParE family toxin [Treponema sp.]